MEGPDPALRADDAEPRDGVAESTRCTRPSRARTANSATTSSTDGTQTAWRVRTRPPSFIHFQVFPHVIKDHMIADVVAVLGSLNIIAAELDR